MGRRKVNRGGRMRPGASKMAGKLMGRSLQEARKVIKRKFQQRVKKRI